MQLDVQVGDRIGQVGRALDRRGGETDDERPLPLATEGVA